MESVGAVGHRVVTKFLRKDIGNSYCLHVDLEVGRIGLSRRVALEDKPVRPQNPDVWLSDEKAVAVHSILEEVVKKRGLMPGQEPTPKPPPLSRSSSAFFQANLQRILAHERGIMQKPPLWLRWLYSAVVTKRELREQDDHRS